MGKEEKLKSELKDKLIKLLREEEDLVEFEKDVESIDDHMQDDEISEADDFGFEDESFEDKQHRAVSRGSDVKHRIW